MGSKGLWRHVEGKAIAPKPYTLVNNIPVLSDGKTPAMEQIEARETQTIKFDKHEYLPQHTTLSTTLTHLSAKIKDMKTTQDMWNAVKPDATTKSMIYLLDAEDQLVSMKLSDNNDPKTHLAELKQHFQLMSQCHDYLTKMGFTLSDSWYNTIIMSSLPEFYQPTLQTITAAERTNAALGMLSKKIKVDDLVTFLIEEAQHCIINDDCTMSAESALAAHGKRDKRGQGDKGKMAEKSGSGHNCENAINHTIPNRIVG